MHVKELAAALGLPFEGDGEHEIIACAPVDTAGPAELSFIGNAKAARAIASSQAGCLIVPADLEASRTVLLAADPRAAFGRAIALFHPPKTVGSGVHPTAIVDPTAKLGANVTVGAYCAIGADVVIGDNSKIYDHVVIYHDVTIGPRAVIHSGTVIGADGFGFVLSGDHYEKFPQVGRVEIGADVEIGANCTIDRASLGRTIIGDGTKLDNMVHIGHNCTVGKHVVIAAQTGLGGGATIGDYAVLGGQVGVADKVRIEAKAIIGAQTGIPSNKIIRAGEPVWGTPARPIKDYLEQLAHLAHLGELRKEVAELKRLLSEKT